jgi:hypothetical protein
MAERVDPQVQSLQTVISKVLSGQWRIPRFQREFVWTPEKLKELLDSITRAYPIGSIVVWEVDDAHRDSFRPLPELDQPQEFERDLYFVLDGQQRCTSLAAAFLGKKVGKHDFRTICYDLDKLEFVLREPDDVARISIGDILAPQQAENAVMDYVLNEDATRYKKLIAIRDAILHYPVPVVTVRNQQLENVAEAFTRLNMAGTKLTVFDLVCARVWTKDFDLRDRFDSDIWEPNAEWVEIDGALVIQAAALHLKGDCTNKAMVELQANELKILWPKLVAGIAAARDWLTNIGVLSGERHLPSSQMLAVLAALDLSNSLAAIDAETQKRMEQWFWKSGFHDRYRSSTNDVMRYDLAWLKGEQLPDTSSMKVGSLESVRSIDEKTLIDTTFKRNSVLVRTYLSMLLHEKPRDLSTGRADLTTTQSVSSFKKKEKHHIFTSELYGGRHNVDSLMNCCFLGAALNKKVGGNKKPSEYLALFNHPKTDLAKILSSNLIPIDGSGAIFGDDFPAFLLARASLVARRINELCGVPNAPAVGEKLSEVQELVRQTELSLREHILARLASDGRDRIVEKFPSLVREYLAQRVLKSANADDAVKLDPVKCLQMLEIKHLEMIITAKKNQGAFVELLKNNSSQTVQLFQYLGDLRNAVQHHREQSLDEASWSLGIGAAKELLRRAHPEGLPSTVRGAGGGASPAEGPGVVDRSYWNGRTSTEVMSLIDSCIGMINEKSDAKQSLNYKRQYIGLTDGLAARNFVWMGPRKKYLYLCSRPAKPPEWSKRLEALGFEVGIEPDYFWITLTPQKFREHEEAVRGFLHAMTAEYQKP